MTAACSRRSLLQRLAIGAGSATLASARVGTAAAAATPRRLLFINVPNGYATKVAGKPANGFGNNAMVVGNPGRVADGGYALGKFTQPFSAFIADMVILENFHFFKEAMSDTHRYGNLAMLTGTYVARIDQQRSANISLDQYLGVKIGRAATPRFPNLALGVQNPVVDGTNSFLADGTPVRPEQDPFKVYADLFARLVPGMPADDAALKARLARRKSVLDAVAGDLADFVKRLPAEDKARADVQLDSIRTLESRLAAELEPGPGFAGACRPPTKPPGTDVTDQASYPAVARMHLDNVVNAFACDLTRVATLMFRGQGTKFPGCGFAPVNRSDATFHGLSHLEDPSWETLKAFTYGLVAEAVTKLKNTPEGGGTMLDNTLVVVGSEIGPGHSLNQKLIWLTIGGKAMGVRTGQYIRFANPTYHSRVLVSLLNAMGLPDTTFGENPGTGEGPVPGFFA